MTEPRGAYSTQTLRGAAAVGADLLTIAGALVVVLAVYFASEGADPVTGLYIPLVALALGAAGALAAGALKTGFIRNWRYVRVYWSTIAVMVAADLAVRLVLGGDLLMVFANWAVLIGSASSVNLFLTRIPLLSARRWLSTTDVSSMSPPALVIAFAIQIAQAWISVLGASLMVVAVQLLVRRLVILPITHTIAHANYGSAAPTLLRANDTLLYVAHRSAANADGLLIEKDPLEQCALGNMLLKLPIFGGEAMNAGRKSLTRVIDKFVFVEQMLAFSSPTFVVSHYTAVAHLAFMQTVVSLDGNAATLNPKLNDAADCKRRAAAFMRGDTGAWTA